MSDHWPHRNAEEMALQHPNARLACQYAPSRSEVLKALDAVPAQVAGFEHVRLLSLAAQLVATPLPHTPPAAQE
ncbi:hypothetical protein E9531_10660 [Lampropedia puyangensis]|uniref:Uncharacterized protein n=1 Tax=Lampropedia puyangensis TaxID=1330072 RepID=A0A4S8F1L2_9BURK|nr:hypothetical protein [Lampropedia puyangensis]THU00225.1 hypothetical protein E9531_10660 [Lampropedia puyangensis]